MRSIPEYDDGMYARWVLEKAQVRAMARRQLALSIPIVLAGAFVAVVSTFNFGHAASPQGAEHRAPVSAPTSRHVVVLVQARDGDFARGQVE
jgi:hypothetical protein